MTRQTARNTLEQFKVSEVELIYRSKVRAVDRPVISDAETAYRILLQHWDENKIELREQFKILLLNTANRCLGIADIGIGGMSSCVIDPKLIFATALKGKASKIILAHNHPSGNLQLSGTDIKLTQKLVAAGQLMDINVLEYLVVTSKYYRSLSESGLIFS